MLKVTILDKPYQIRNNWEDNTIKQMGMAQNYISAMPKWLSNYIYSDKDEPVSDSKLLGFYVDWIEMFSNSLHSFNAGVIIIRYENQI